MITDGEPMENDILEAIPSAHNLSQVLPLTLDSQLSFRIEHRQSNRKPKIFCPSVIVRMPLDATFYLDSGRAKLYFSQNDRGIQFHRIEGKDANLSALFMAMPSLPAVKKIGLLWQDYLPISMATQGFQQMSYQLMSSFDPRLASARYEGEWRSPDEVVGVVSVIGDRKKIYTNVRIDL